MKINIIIKISYAKDLEHNWKARWQRRAATAQRQRLSRYVESAEEDFPFGDPLAKHKKLLKHESSVLIQLYIEKIELNSFLY